MKPRIHKTHWITRLVLLLALLALNGCGQPDTPEQVTTPLSPLPTAAAYLSEGDLNAARQVWQQALERDADDAEAYYHLGLILVLTDQGEARHHLERAESLDAVYADPVSRLKTALRQTAVIDDPAYQFTLIGQALASIEEWVLAEIALEEAVALEPGYAEAWAYLGETRQHTGSSDPLSALQTAHALKPDSFAANLFLSIYYRRAGQSLAAIKYLETAIDADPENKDLQADLAQTLVEAGGVSKGFQILESMAAEAPDDVDSWLRLARLSIDNNLQVTQSGIPAARQALMLAPDHPEAALLLGRGYLFLEDKILAERFLDQALQIDDQLPEAYYYLAILYLNAGEGDKAKSNLLAARELANQHRNTILADQIETVLDEYFED